jgi:SAM-dependent methyltransferase
MRGLTTITALGTGFALGAWFTSSRARTASHSPSIDLDLKDSETQKQIIRKAYAQRAKNQDSCCGGSSATVENVARILGYSEADVQEFSGDDGTNLGESCGNPLSFANLRTGEVVVDLGSGAGFDALIAGRAVGSDTGRVIGVDMTPEMVDRARRNASRREEKASHVEFRLGEIEHLPVEDGVVDCLISNCVINLAKDKMQVFKEALRVLKPGGRIAIADVIATDILPERLINEKALAC